MEELTSNKLMELLQHEEFYEKVIKATSLAEEVKILHENGINITEEELQKCGELGVDMLKKEGFISEDGEVNVDVLDRVAGGKIGGTVMLGGATMVGTALASDYLAGACAVGLVSNPVGWFFGGVAVMVAGAYLIGKKK